MTAARGACAHSEPEGSPESDVPDSAVDGSLTAEDVSLDRIYLSLPTEPDSSGLAVAYTAIEGNRPKSNENTVALWDTWEPILVGPARTKPLGCVRIASELRRSTAFIPYAGLTGSDYLVTYQVGRDLSTMAASLRICLELGSTPPSGVALSVYELRGDRITVKYETLGGYRPHSLGNWVGAWQGLAGPFGAPPPDAWAPVASDSTVGLVTLSGLTIIDGFPYRIIYFMGPDAGVPGSAIGAVLTFTAARRARSATR